MTRHWLVLVIVVVLSAGAFLLTSWLVSAKEAEIAETQTQNAATLAELDQEIEEIKARKAEEERLRKLEEAKKTAAAVIANPQKSSTIDASTCNVSGTHNDPSQIDVLVNKKHCVQPLSYAPTDLVTAYGATLSAKAITQFKKMYEAAQAAGQGFSVTSSYRSYSTQVSTYNYWVGVSGAAGADTYSARPGYSEHQTGFVIDVANASGSCALDCFGTTSQYQWMQKNAAKYGFIQRYYKGYDDITGYTAEEWHYRYVGADVAQDMKTKGVKTLEQYWGLPGGKY